MLKTDNSNRNATSATTATEGSINDFDPATPSTWSSAILSQLRTLTVERLQDELKTCNLSHTGKKRTLLKRLYESLHSEGQETMTTEVASPRSPPTPQRHSDATTSHNDANAAIDQSNALQQLSSQLKQPPQQQLTNLLLQAISGQPTLTQHTIPSATTDATSSQTRQLPPDGNR